MRLIRPINQGGTLGLKLFKWLGVPGLELARMLQYPSRMYGNELLYERMFAHALHRFGLENRYYGTGGAATYSLMYLLLRAITELPVNRVVEMGCGQSSLLLDALQKVRPFAVTSLEDDAGWADRIQRQVEHEVVHADLVERRIRRRKTRTYNISVAASGPCDLLLVDGPQQRGRRCRWGALEWVEQGFGDHFILLFDDAERRGELDTIEEALKILRSQSRTYRTRFFYSTTWQFAIAGGDCTPIVSF